MEINSCPVAKRNSGIQQKLEGKPKKDAKTRIFKKNFKNILKFNN